MKKPIIIGNWKSNKTLTEAREWFAAISTLGELGAAELIICPPFPLLTTCKEAVDTLCLPINLGAQNISPFPDGAYTGEVSGRMLIGLVQYVIIGHSERRKNFAETDEVLLKKVKQAHDASITPIYCIQDETTLIPDGVNWIAYEPSFAIGSGQPDSPQHACHVGEKIKAKRPQSKFIYGGSITPQIVSSYLDNHVIDGVLPGGASLDAKTFYELISHATKTT